MNVTVGTSNANIQYRYISNIEMPGGTIIYIPLQPPKNGATEVSSAGDWTIDMAEVEKAINPKTKMIVLNTPYDSIPFLSKRFLTMISHNPVGKIFSKSELQAIGDLCIKHNILILSDEVRPDLTFMS